MTSHFSAATRGKTMGLWSTGASAGNITGILLYTSLSHVPGITWKEIIIACAGIIILVAMLFKVLIRDTEEAEPLLHKHRIGFLEAWRIAGVVEYTLVYSCCKFMNYAWIMWLPYYLYTVVQLGHLEIGVLTLLYEAGAVVGACGGGWVSDKVHSRSGTVKIMLCFAAPLSVMLWYADENMIVPIGFSCFGLGVSVAGVCYLMNSCVSADLAVGSHQIATISGIMDGTGSLVAGVGVFFVGYLQTFSWAYVFGIVVLADIIAVSALVIIKVKKTQNIC